MKRFFTALLSLTAVFLLAGPVQADVLWSPFSNTFFDLHYSEFSYIGRYYYANSSEGFVTLWDAPNGGIVVTQYENGQELHVFYQYEDWAHRDWALIGDWLEDVPEDTPWIEREIAGWVPLEDLKIVYDRISFEGDYASEIRNYHGEIARYAGDLTHINFFEYPGAPEVKEAYEFNDVFLRMLEQEGSSPARMVSECASKAFIDEDGRSWYYVDIYGSNGWFCLDDPTGTDFPLREIPEPQLEPAQTPVLPTVSYVPYLLVVGVVAVTALLLIWFYSREKNGGKS